MDGNCRVGPACQCGRQYPQTRCERYKVNDPRYHVTIHLHYALGVRNHTQAISCGHIVERLLLLTIIFVVTRWSCTECLRHSPLPLKDLPGGLGRPRRSVRHPDYRLCRTSCWNRTAPYLPAVGRLTVYCAEPDLDSGGPLSVFPFYHAVL